jgi:ABC-type lipoprotein export system ATPase subunit
VTAPLLSVRGLVRNYQALRPLRLASLEIAAGDVVSIAGLDAAAAELFVGLATGALLPDEGDVALFGRSTRDVGDSDEWLAMLDGVGILTDRAVLIAPFTVEQNLAMPFTLEVDPIAAGVRPQVAALAREVGVHEHMATTVAHASSDVVARVRLGRALALGPRLLIAEHPSAALSREAVTGFAADVRQIAKSRDLGLVVLTADSEFAAALGGVRFTLDPATGTLRPHGIWRKLLRR